MGGNSQIIIAFKTVSTDDAYVNGHVTFVAPRVPGHVVRVLVDDNNRVHKGDLLVQLDKEPYQVQVDIAQAAVGVAQSDLVAAQAKDQSLAGLARSQRYDLAHADRRSQQPGRRAACLGRRAAGGKRNAWSRARADFERVRRFSKPKSYRDKSSMRTRRPTRWRRRSRRRRSRKSIGFAPLSDFRHRRRVKTSPQVPPDLDQTFSAVKAAQARLQQTAAQLGIAPTFEQSPDQMLADFYKRDPSGNIDSIFAQLLKAAPDVCRRAPN